MLESVFEVVLNVIHDERNCNAELIELLLKKLDNYESRDQVHA